ncbi:DotA/TraY family protein [Piscirickettsia litoralis]|uniref:Type IV secretion protein DotA n=1 Tax=Piscirickettsia litoralis TaxID=1891921 RepID=A0ABX3A4R4_9GAMM|nr:DotA/TraY family protein [Piscirickettsia litoralis]ODN43847.1 type IV secretion protein DotA [Piscirickettsia litoralis]
MSFIIPGPVDDQSVSVLQQIFGEIIPWLAGQNTTGTDTTIIHSIIASFNTGLLSLLLVIYAVIIFVGTLNTAHQGEFLGRNWSSMWMPLRAIFGPLCVVPIKYGFCLAQIVLLYGVLVGVNLADKVWKSVEIQVDNLSIPTVPVSLLNDVKQSVANAVLYKSVLKVAPKASDKNPDDKKITLDDDGVICQDGKSSVKGNMFYTVSLPDNKKTQALCVNSQSTIPSSLLPKLSGYARKICTGNNGTLSEFATAMDWFYGDPYHSSKISFDHPGTPEITASSLTQMCINAIQSLLSGTSSSTSKEYDYNFNVVSQWYDGSHNYHEHTSRQTIVFKSSLGDSSYHGGQSSSGDEVFVPAQGHIAFNFENMDYTNSATKKNSGKYDYSQAADQATTQIIDDLYNASNDTDKDVNQANKVMANYLKKLNNHLLGDTKNSSTPTDVSKIIDANNNSGDTGYDTCKVYLDNSNELNFRYLECLQLESTGDSTGDLVEGEKPFASYINSWWMGGESYLSIDSIMNSNLQAMQKRLDQAISYPGMSIISTIKYDIPINVNFYPLGNGQIPGNADKLQQTAFSDSYGVESTTYGIPDGLNLISSSWLDEIDNTVPPLISKQGCSADHYAENTLCGTERAVDELRSNLLSLPDEMHAPFIYLFELYTHNGDGGSLVPATDDSSDFNSSDYNNVYFLNRVFKFLQNNGIYQPTTTTSVPVYGVIDKIFSNLGGNGLSSDITSIMNELYELGTPASANNSKVFSKIMQAQQVGADVISAVIDSFANIYQNYKKKFDNIQDTAHSMVSDWAVGAGFAGGIGALFGASGAGAAVAIAGQTAVQLYMAAQMGNIALSLAWFPVAMIVLGSLFTAAIAFVVMMPLIPYILFWAGTIVWLLSILEGLVAVPLVALALVYPEGHEILGHGSPAVKIALNIMFRPVLMVIGIISAIALTYVLITYSAQGFHLVAPLILNNFTSDNLDMVRGIVSCFLVFVYASFMMMAFNKCFSVIYLIPDKVFEWIGAASGHRAGLEEVQQLQGKTESTASQTGQAMGSGVEKGVQANQQETQSTVSADSQHIQVAEKSGEAGGNEARSAAEALM